MIKITSLREDENRIDFVVDGQPYHTNPEGYGLWIGEDYLRQIEGTAQFSLRQKTRNGVYKALKKDMKSNKKRPTVLSVGLLLRRYEMFYE